MQSDQPMPADRVPADRVPADRVPADRVPADRERMSLARLVGIVASFGLVLIVLASVGVAWGELRRRERDAETLAQSTAFFLADHASRLFEVADVAMAATSASLGARGWDDIAQDSALQERMKATASALPYVQDIWLNEQSGQLRLTSRAFPAPASDATDRLAFKLIQRRDSGLVVGDLIIGKVTDEPTFLLARRLSWADGSLRGMVSVTADLAYFDDYWRRLALPFDPQVSLLRSSGETLARYPAGAARDDAFVAERPVGDLPLSLRVAFSRSAQRAAWGVWLGSFLPSAFVAFVALAGLGLLGFRQAAREENGRAELARARAQLAAANAGLEETVARRTAELRAANEDVQQFAYLVSHDLRAPLVNVLGFTGEVEAIGAELLAADAAPPDGARRAELEQDLREAIGFIRASATSMDRQLRHVLSLAREGRRVFRPEQVDMTEMMRTLADGVRFQAEQAGIVIDVAPLPPVVADRLALEQVFGNLLDNAVKYLDPARPGLVQVNGRTGEHQVVYEVSDNGRGIAPGEQAKVFEMFRRAGAQDQPGEGMGLAHVKALVRGLGGSIELRSELGQGAVFRVALPVGVVV